MDGANDATNDELRDFWNRFYWVAIWASIFIAAAIHVGGKHYVDFHFDLVFAAWTLAAQLLALRWPYTIRFVHALSTLPFIAYYCSLPGILVGPSDRPMVYVIFSFFPVYTISAMSGLTGVIVSMLLAFLAGFKMLVASPLMAAVAPIYWGLASMIGYGHYYLAKELEDRYQKLTTMALSDPLTGLGNRRALEQDFRRYQHLAAREGKQLILTLWDINDLKKINDIHGHDFGDSVIKQFARTVTNTARNSDPFYRIGGDEFAGLHIGIENPNELIRRIREKSPWVSAGWAYATHLDFDEAYKKADQNMYTDKSTKPTDPAIFDLDFKD